MYQLCPPTLVRDAKLAAQRLGQSLATLNGRMPNPLEAQGLEALLVSAVRAIADMTLRSGLRDISGVGEGHPFEVPIKVFRTANHLDRCLHQLNDPDTPKSFHEMVATAVRDIEALSAWEPPPAI